MPIYEFVCDECGEQFERLKNKSGKGLRETCPSCGGTSRQQLSTFGVSIGGGDASPCSDGMCPTDGCPTGSCPYSQN